MWRDDTPLLDASAETYIRPGGATTTVSELTELSGLGRASVRKALAACGWTGDTKKIPVEWMKASGFWATAQEILARGGVARFKARTRATRSFAGAKDLHEFADWSQSPEVTTDDAVAEHSILRYEAGVQAAGDNPRMAVDVYMRLGGAQ